MPKDESSFTESSGSTPCDPPRGGGPLKRGDACLYCRKRRIRCSATKPSCHHCTKLKRECVYDSGKPVSRVRQLEEKVAELEGYLRAGAGAPPPPPPATVGSASISASSIPAAAPSAMAASLSLNTSAGLLLNSLNNMASPTAYAFPPGTLDQSTVDIDMLDTFEPAPGMPRFTPAPATFATFGGGFASGLSGVAGALGGIGNMAGISTSLAGVGFGLGGQEPPFDFSTLDPGFMSLVQSFEASMSSVGADIGVGAGALSDSSKVPGSIAAAMGSSSMPPTSTTPLPLPLALQVPIAGENPSVSNAPTPGTSMFQAYVADEVDLENCRDRKSSGVGSGTANTGWKPDIPLDEGSALVGGWFDAADLPRVARDHLLELFFSGMRLFGQEFHVPRFYASLTLPMAKRPHPCLLYAMYLLAARVSPSPPIRQLENHFHTIATAQLQESIAHSDRLFDATRAATMIAVYKYSMAKYHEGSMMSGLAARLAVSCGLHQIHSSVFKPSPIPTDKRANLLGIMRHRAWVLPPPADAIELGERIWAFWSIFTVDRCGSIASQWPPSIPDDIVATPYPKPLYEYELGLTYESDDYTISSLYDPTAPQMLPHYSDSTATILRLRGFAILERASKLMYLDTEPGVIITDDTSHPPSSRTNRTNSSGPPSVSPSGGIDEYLTYQNYQANRADANPSSSTSTSASGGATTGSPAASTARSAARGSNRCARVRTPRAYEEVRRALLRIENDLPPERRTNWAVWDGTVQDWHFSQHKKDVVMLHFVLGCAWMFLFDVYSYNAENHEAVAVARRLSFTIRCMLPQALGGEIDVFIAMCWSFIVKILIREEKRLQSLGDVAAVAPIASDVETVVQALRTFGNRYNIASIQALRADRYRESTLDDMAFLEGDGFDDYHVQIERLFETGGTFSGGPLPRG